MLFCKREVRITEDGRRNVAVLRLSIDLDGDLAFIDWEPSGDLYFIKTPVQHRRKGIASKLWQAANDFAASNNLPNLAHSEYRTDEGEAWAQSMTSELPQRISS
jgi:ribosomal protein S18 acetylase RimI-like enzyme